MSAVTDVLLDTNLLVYAHDTSEVQKGPKARALLAALFAVGQPVVGVQALSEFYWTVTRKIAKPLNHASAVAECERFAMLAKVVPTTWEVFEAAMILVSRHRLPLWDAQIVARGKLSGCTRLLTEDLQHRSVIDGLTILNPFAADFDPLEAL